MDSTGLAFSGGGIRSAALCSGVLRRLLERNVEVDYLSCVSGGGYTGTAYLDWKYREEKKAKAEWHQNFFENMKQKAGYICSWSNPFQGICDTIIISLLVVSVAFIQPIIIWGSYACPVAFTIDFLFGWLLRDKSNCDGVARTAIAGGKVGSNSAQLTHEIGRSAIGKDCRLRQETVAFDLTVLFGLLFILFITSYILSRLTPKARSFRLFFRMSQYTSFVFLALTFISFAIHDLFLNIPLWAQLLVVPLLVTAWIVLPLLRNKTSYVLIVFLYSYFTYWKVYEAKLFGIPFSDELFNKLLVVSGITIWIVPVFASLHQRIVHVYNRWRLQRAFYHKDGLGAAGCSGIGFRDICPLWKCASRNEDDIEAGARPLTLADLRGMKPKYISNVVVNRWKKDGKCKDSYELLMMSPTAIERFDRDPKTKQFEGKLEPEDVKLSDAMATSAAALSVHMGKYDLSIKGLTRLRTVLGLEMGATLISDAKALKDKNLTLALLVPSLLHIVRGIPLIAALPTLCHDCDSTDFQIQAAVITFVVIHIALAFIALVDTGAEEPGWSEKVARWFIVHNSFVHYMREIFSKNNRGPMPPAMMLLSDGGHIENLGLLPLLKKRLSRIVVVDGGYKDDENEYGESLLNALMLARTKLNCSFLSVDNHDVISDMLETFVHPQPGGNPRYFKLVARASLSIYCRSKDAAIFC